MEELKIASVKGIQDVHVFQLCECDAVAAYTLDEALDWYKEQTGLTDDELYDYEDMDTIPLDHKVHLEEGNNEMITVSELLDRYWEGTPFIAITTDC